MPQNAHQANQLLARTINVPLNLGSEIENGYTVHLSDQWLDQIAGAGFSAIRIGARWTNHVEQAAPYRIEQAAFEKVDAVVTAITKRGLAVVIDNHPDVEIMADPVAFKARFLAITQQVTEHFKHSPASVFLEILAEPQAKLDPLWNDYLAEALRVVRGIDQNRMVVIGPCSYNNARKLPQLHLPDNDQNIIVTIHHYWPLNFTMQGEAWVKIPWFMQLLLGKPSSWPGTLWKGTPKERKQLAGTFESIATWAKQHNRPIFLGEFGSSNSADMTSRARWAQYIRELAESHNFSWGCWSFAPTFALYDLQKNQWHEELLNSLIPQHARASQSLIEK